MSSRAYSGISRRAKKPNGGPMVPSNFNKKFAEFATKKGMDHGPLTNPGFRKKKAA